MGKTNQLSRWPVEVTGLDIAFFTSVGIALCLGLLFFLVNLCVGHYMVIDFNHGFINKIGIIVLEIYAASFFLSYRFPKVSLIMKGLGMLYVTTYLGCFLVSGMETTSFHLHDAFFQRVDHWMGFDLVTALRYVAHYPWLETAISTVYNSLEIAMMTVILMLAVIHEKKQLYRYMTALTIAMALGALIYYFIPTTSPESVIHHFKFVPDQLFVLKQFNAIHHYAPVINSPSAGIIGFPSFHTIWPILLLYSVWNNKMVRWLALAYAVLVPISAVLIGWHFLIDIIGGIAVSGISIVITEYILRLTKEND